MPYFRDENLEDKDQNGGVQLSSGGTQADPEGNPQQGDSKPKSSNTGSHFQNLDSYINNNDAKGFGQQFGQNVQKSIDQAKQDVDQGTSDVKSQINAGANPATSEQIKGALDAAGTGTTPEQAKQYQDWTTQTYGGPMSLADNAGAQGKVEGGIRTAETNARQAGTEAGRFALLDQYYGRPSYNFGEKSLDNLLVERGGGFNDPKQYQDQASALGAYGNTQAKSIQDAASQKAAQVEQSKNAARAAIGLQADGTVSGGALGDFQTGLDQRVTDANNNRDADWAALMKSASGDTLDTRTLARTGLKAGANLSDLNLRDYLIKGGDYTKDNLSSDSDRARYGALSQMAGINPTYLNDAGKAETAAGPSRIENGFDTNRFNKDLGSESDAYQYDSQQALPASIVGQGLINQNMGVEGRPITMNDILTGRNAPLWWDKGGEGISDAHAAYSNAIADLKAKFIQAHPIMTGARTLKDSGLAPNDAVLPNKFSTLGDYLR